jgi:hypothetical protein
MDKTGEIYISSSSGRWISHRVGDDPFDIGVDGSYEGNPVTLASWFQDGLYVFLSECKRHGVRRFLKDDERLGNRAHLRH